MIPSEPPYFVTNPTCRPQFTIRALFVLVLAGLAAFGLSGSGAGEPMRQQRQSSR
jgi:hypothetical protein